MTCSEKASAVQRIVKNKTKLTIVMIIMIYVWNMW